MSEDSTPPSQPDRVPPWGRQFMKDHYQLRKDHDHLKSKQAADTMAHIHMLSGIAVSVAEVSADILKVNRQIWGAIKELRGQLKTK